MANKSKIRLKCCIPECKTIFGEDKSIKFHKIRKSVTNSESEKQKWMAALPFLKNEDFLKAKYLICSLHFRDEDYIHRPLRHFKREKDLKPNIIPSLNLPSTAKSHSNLQRRRKRKQNFLESPEIDSTLKELENQYSLHNPPTQKIGCQCKTIKTKNVGIQCEIISSTSSIGLSDSFNDNIDNIRGRSEEKQISTDITSDEEFLAEINDGEIISIKRKKYKLSTELTCDLPNDDVFFKEISKKNSELSDVGFYCCDQCGLIFTDFKSYRDHEGVHAEISLLCYFCGEISVDYMKHVEHEYKCKKIKQIENENVPTKKKNSKKYSKNPNLESETIQNCTYSKTLKTDIDFRKFSVPALEKMAEFVEYFCDICKEVFVQEDIYNEHLQEHCTMDIPEIKAEIHDISIANQREYKISGNTTIEFLKNPVEEFNCQLCGKSYATEYLLNRHIDIKHLNPVRKSPVFQCNECEMTFRNVTKLQNHIREHVVSQKHCKICNIVYDNNGKYLKHLETLKHLSLEEKWKNRYNIKLFSCLLCKTEETQYNRLSDLADHSKFHRVSKTRTFINSLLAEHEINFEPSILV